MKELIISFLKKNWLKLGVAGFLIFVALQDNLSLNVNLNKPKSSPAVPTQQREVAKQEILSDLQLDKPVAEQKANRFNLKPSIFSWKSSKKETSAVSKPKTQKKVQALAKLSVLAPEDLEAFIKRFAHVAIGEQEKYGVPASIIIANGMLMSTASQSVLSKDQNNFFQLPCSEDWNGEETYLFGRCYRTYETAWLSFRDHSIYLRQLKIVAGKELASDDYKAWAKFLGQQKFGNEKDYRRQLVQLIEDMELFYLDQSE